MKRIIEEIEKAKVVKRPRGNPGGAPHNLYYKDVICAFDIETSRDPETNNSFMYSWGFACNDKYISGRTWEEFRELKKGLLAASKGAAIPVYVHNLSFEFQFLSGVLDFEPGRVLCGKRREIVKAYSEPLEFRCSYKLTGLSLDNFTKEMNVENKKLSGAKFDYSKLRYPWTKLTSFEEKYQANDCIGLVQAIKKQMDIYGDNIYTIPITQTGYIRREIKRRMRTYPWKRTAEQRINIDIYRQLNVAMRGGNCHANRYITGDVQPGADCWDISSAYPAAMVYGLYPMGRWTIDSSPTIDRLLKLIYWRNKPVLATLKFKNLRTRDKYEIWPYIPVTKSVMPDKRHNKSLRVDNGRVIASDELIGVYTDIDFKIIMDMYTWDDVEIIKLAYNKYGYLPNQIREYVLELYQTKTQLKGVDPIIYAAKKREINGLYGMLAEDPGKIYNMYIDNDFQKENITVEAAVARKVEKAFLSYAWGVWTTSIVRSWIQDLLNQLGEAAYYCDTDGIKNVPGYKAYFEAFNNVIEKKAKEYKGAIVPDQDGVIHMLGAWEYEGAYNEFITLGAKKYAYKEGNNIYIATAGVNKEKGGKELKRLENYKEGFTFKEAGGNEAIYNDDVDLEVIREGHKLHITKNVTIQPSTYTLGRTEEYKKLCIYSKAYLAFINRQKNA